MREERPWGSFEVLAEDDGYKVKRIVVNPGQRLSLQLHTRRSEHWVAVRGRGIITRDDQQVELAAGDSIDIPLKAAHRAANPGAEPFVFIEVQRGDYLGEDDIERLEDDYGRPLAAR